MRKFIGISLVIILLFLITLPLGSTQVKNPKVSTRKVGTYGGTLVVASISDPKSFNPIIAKETSTTAITDLIFSGLTETNGVTTEVEPGLAESWTFSKDGLIWTFHLREGITWFDGKPLTADDVVFTFNDLIYNKDVPTSARDVLTIDGKYLKVEKVNTYTVRFTLPKPFAPLLRQLGTEIMPKHILEKSVKEGTFSSTWGVNTPPDKIIGCGPFMLKEYVPSQRVVLVRNPNYWKVDKAGNRLPYLDKIVVLIVPDQDTALLKFQAGEIDIYGMRSTDYPILKPLEKSRNFTIFNGGPTFGTNFVVFNQNPKGVNPIKLKWFTNLKFRQAIAQCLDRESIINNIFLGLAAPQYSPMSKGAVFFYNDRVKKYEYDLNKARSLLLEGGFRYNKNGELMDSEGNRVEFNLETNAGNRDREAIGNILKEDLKKVGMKVNFAPIDFNTLVTKLTSNFDWEAIIIGLTGGVEPHGGRNVWHSSGQLHMWHPLQERPATPWEAKIDEIFDKGATELNPQKRKALYDEWQFIISEQLPLIHTVNPVYLAAIRNKFENVEPTAFGGVTHNIEEIYLRK